MLGFVVVVFLWFLWFSVVLAFGVGSNMAVWQHCFRFWGGWVAWVTMFGSLGCRCGGGDVFLLWVVGYCDFGVLYVTEFWCLRLLSGLVLCVLGIAGFVVGFGCVVRLLGFLFWVALMWFICVGLRGFALVLHFRFGCVWYFDLGSANLGFVVWLWFGFGVFVCWVSWLVVADVLICGG